jgi:hypothetical protein
MEFITLKGPPIRAYGGVIGPDIIAGSARESLAKRIPSIPKHLPLRLNRQTRS